MGFPSALNPVATNPSNSTRCRPIRDCKVQSLVNYQLGLKDLRSSHGSVSLLITMFPRYDRERTSELCSVYMNSKTLTPYMIRT